MCSSTNSSSVLLFVQKLGLQHFILYAHGPDLCHDLNIKHALANCFEAVMGTCLGSLLLK